MCVCEETCWRKGKHAVVRIDLTAVKRRAQKYVETDGLIQAPVLRHVSLLHSIYERLHPLSCDGVRGEMCKPPRANTIPYNRAGYICWRLLLRLSLYKVG
jgi:hypothetical protein